MWEELTRDELSSLMFLIASLIDKQRSVELIRDIMIGDDVVNEYANLIGIEDERAMKILRTYGNFFITMIDTKVKMNHARLIGSITGELPYSKGKPL